MNRFITISIVASLAVGMLSCTKEAPVEDNVVSGSSFTVFASAAETKTAVNDEMNGVVWSDGDQLNIFHAPAGKTVYVPDGSFTFSEGIKFNGEVTGELSSTNDWYAIYPYKEQITTPASTEGGYQYIGSRSDKSQTQDGNDSMAHLAGTNYPLYGVAKAVAKDETPSFTMEQLCSVVAIKVTNTTNKPLTVSSVSFTGTENIVGTFFVDFTGNTPSFSDGPHVGTEASLTVNNAEPLSNGEYATYYIAIKPFKAGAESKLYVSVNGYSKEIAIEKETSFTSGKIKKINFAYDNTASNFTWNLAEDNTIIASDTRMYWSSDCATMLVKKGNSTTATNNYYPGTVGKTYTSTRFYGGSILTIKPAKGVTVSRVVFEATTSSYALGLSNSTWANAESSVTANSVTVTPTDGTQAISATIDEICGLTSVIVHYTGEPDNTPYRVTVASDITGGTVTASQTSATEGALIMLTATPASNYQFDSWTVTNSSTNEPITVTDAEFIMPASDVNVRASFNKIYDGTITTISAADAADIKLVAGSSSETGAVWANSTTLSANNITLSGSVTSGTNYSYFDGSVVRFYTNNNIVITPSEGATIEKIEIVRQSTTGSNSGTINCSGLKASSENSTTNTNVFTGTATSAVTFTVTQQARFTEIKIYSKIGGVTPTVYTVSVADNISNGTVTTSTTSASEGTTVNLTATPADGYEFQSWNVTGAIVADATNATTTFTMPAANVIVSASFKGKTTSTEPFEWNGGGKNSLTEMEGVTGYGLGSDYAAANAPYQVKLDNTGDYIIIELAYEIASVQLKAKMIGGASSSSIMIQESDSKTGTFTDVQEMTISGSQNDVIDFTTSTMFKSGSRAVKLYFTKGANIGLGYIKIAPKK